MTNQPTPYSRKKSELQKRVCSPRWWTWVIYSHFPSSFRLEWRLPDIKDGDQIGSTTMTARTNPTPSSYVLPRRRTLSHKMRVELLRLEIRWTNQVKVKAWPILSGSGALSQKLIFCDMLIAKSFEIMRLTDSYVAGAWHPLPPSPSSTSFLHGQRRRKTLCNTLIC